MPAIGTIGNMTLAELRAAYVTLHPVYVGSTTASSPAALRTLAQETASRMSIEELRLSLRNIRHHGSYDPATNPRPVREDTPPRTSNASSSSSSSTSTANHPSSRRSGR